MSGCEEESRYKKDASRLSLHPFGLWRLSLFPCEAQWVQVSSSESKWIQVNPSKSKWAHVSPSESKLGQVSLSVAEWVPSPSPQSSCPASAGLGSLNAGWPFNRKCSTRLRQQQFHRQQHGTVCCRWRGPRCACCLGRILPRWFNKLLSSC